MGKWLFLASAVAALAGSATAFFLFALDWATATRLAHRWLIWPLPIAGFGVGWLYLHFGKHVEAGNNLSAPALSNRLLMAARHSGIHQALLHSVHAGYLPGKKLSHHHVEGASAHHPLCIELIDIEERLRAFLHEHADELRHVRAVMFRCELAL